MVDNMLCRGIAFEAELYAVGPSDGESRRFCWPSHLHTASSCPPSLPSPLASLPQAVSSGYHPVLALKNARVGDFNGKTLSTGGVACVAAVAVMFTLLE